MKRDDTEKHLAKLIQRYATIPNATELAKRYLQRRDAEDLQEMLGLK